MLKKLSNKQETIMKFTINKTSLLKILQPLSKAIPIRSTLPVLGCALFTQKNNKLNIRTTDLEISISIDCDVKNFVEGSVAIPLNKLLEITNAIKEGTIDFSISDEVFYPNNHNLLNLF